MNGAFNAHMIEDPNSKEERNRGRYNSYLCDMRQHAVAKDSDKNTSQKRKKEDKNWNCHELMCPFDRLS